MMGKRYYEDRKCTVCGAVFHIRKDAKRTMCHTCQVEERRKKLGCYIKCKNCGKTFKHRHSTTKFCSKSCAIEFRHKEKSKIIKCDFCGKLFERPNCHISEHNFCSKECMSRWYSENIVGEHHPNWTGGRQIQNGYVFLNVGGGRRVQEHRIIAEQKIGRKLLPSEVVHHIDGDKTNNDPSNLVVLTRAEHRALHDADIRAGKQRRHQEALSLGVKTADIWWCEE